MKDNLGRKTDAELEARRQRVLKILDGEPPQPARMERMLRRIENEQARRQDEQRSAGLRQQGQYLGTDRENRRLA